MHQGRTELYKLLIKEEEDDDVSINYADDVSAKGERLGRLLGAREHTHFACSHQQSERNQVTLQKIQTAT